MNQSTGNSAVPHIALGGFARKGRSRPLTFLQDLLMVLGTYLLSWTLTGLAIYSLQFVIPRYIASSERPGSGTYLALHGLFPLPVVAFSAGALLRLVLGSRAPLRWALVLGCLLGLSWGRAYGGSRQDTIDRDMRTGAYIAGGATVVMCVLGAALLRRKREFEN